MTSPCHIIAIVIAVIAVIAAAIGIATVWTVAAADLSTVNPGTGASNVNVQTIQMTLWRRYVQNTGGDKTSESWASYFDGRLDQQYCPESASKTGQTAYDRLRVTEAFSVITCAFAVIHVIVICMYMAGCLRHACCRVTYFLTGFLTAACGAITIAVWFAFINYCDSDLCARYNAAGGSGSGVGSTSTSLQATNETYCRQDVGFGFEVVVMGLALLSIIFMCLSGPPHRHRDHVVYVKDTHPAPAAVPYADNHHPTHVATPYADTRPAPVAAPYAA